MFKNEKFHFILCHLQQNTKNSQKDIVNWRLKELVTDQ